MNKKFLITTLSTSIISLTLLGVSCSTKTHATTEQISSIPSHINQNKFVNIPDSTLKKAINKVLKQPSNSSITEKQMASITTLDIDNLGIKSIEGLQYCTNLDTLCLGDGLQSITHYKMQKNEISDLSPLANLTKLTHLEIVGLQVTDLSPLKNLPLDIQNYYFNTTFLGGQLVTLHVNQNADGSVTFKNPFTSLKGNPMKLVENKCNAKYDVATNTITIPKKYALLLDLNLSFAPTPAETGIDNALGSMNPYGGGTLFIKVTPYR